MAQRDVELRGVLELMRHMTEAWEISIDRALKGVKNGSKHLKWRIMRRQSEARGRKSQIYEERHYVNEDDISVKTYNEKKSVEPLRPITSYVRMCYEKRE